MEQQDLVCIVCPLGCRLTVTKNNDKPSGYEVLGNKCNRGEAYAVKELTNPERVLITTVKIKDAYLNRLPVRSKGLVPKERVFDCMKFIATVEITSPVKMGDVVVKDILGTGTDLIASRSM